MLSRRQSASLRTGRCGTAKRERAALEATFSGSGHAPNLPSIEHKSGEEESDMRRRVFLAAMTLVGTRRPAFGDSRTFADLIETPSLADKVKAGELPPVKARVPGCPFDRDGIRRQRRAGTAAAGSIC